MNASSLVSAALDELLTPGTKLSDSLQKIKAIGYFIGNQELKRWAELELNGYVGSGVEVPEYRKIGTVPRANFVHEDFAYNRGWQANQAIAAERLGKEMYHALTSKRMGNSIAEIEEISLKDEDPRIQIPEVICADISTQIYTNGWSIHSGWQLIPRTQMVGMLTAIRSKLIDLLLELDQLDKDVSLQSLQGKQAATETVSKALHSITVTGGNVNISHGSGAVQAANSGDAAQLNTAGNDATQSVTPVQAATIHELVQQVKLAIAQDTVFDSHREEMEQEMERIEVQLQKPEPKKGIIKRAVESLQELAVKGAGIATGHAVYELLKQAPALLDAINQQ
jgi:hypothetical protein